MVFFFCFDLNLEIYIDHSIFCQPHKDTYIIYFVSFTYIF